MVPLDTPITTPLVHDGAATVPPSHTPGMPSSSPLNNSSSSVSPLPAAPTLLGQTHPMVTRAQNNIFCLSNSQSPPSILLTRHWNPPASLRLSKIPSGVRPWQQNSLS